MVNTRLGIWKVLHQHQDNVIGTQINKVKDNAAIFHESHFNKYDLM